MVGLELPFQTVLMVTQRYITVGLFINCNGTVLNTSLRTFILSTKTCEGVSSTRHRQKSGPAYFIIVAESGRRVEFEADPSFE